MSKHELVPGDLTFSLATGLALVFTRAPGPGVHSRTSPLRCLATSVHVSRTKFIHAAHLTLVDVGSPCEESMSAFTEERVLAQKSEK